MSSSFYRPEIDGLRAMAIIPVVLFHVEWWGFSGGYVGVDIFFVISGFLITSILLREIHKGTFSLLGFWERRVRRIVPALVAVLLATFVAGVVLLLFQNDLWDFGRSMIAQSIFLSNVYFMLKNDYFAAPAEAFPLLHTWSLSVEEQFYILFPLLLFGLVWWLKARAQQVLIVLALASFAASIYFVNVAPTDTFSLPFLSGFGNSVSNQTAGFYLLPMRAWELLMGALLAVSALSISSKRLAEGVSLLGFALIIYAVTQFTDATPFPGIAALVPTLGCALIIMANTKVQTAVGKLLSLPLLVGVGLISYSLYLWHWPVFVFADILVAEKTLIIQTILVALSVILAWLTYLYIETPFRKRGAIFASQSSVLIAGVASLLILVGLGTSLKFIDTGGRVPVYAQNVVEAKDPVGAGFEECYRRRGDAGAGTPCTIGSGTAPITHVVWGDSHAAVLLPIIDQIAREQNVGVAFFAYQACIPISNTYRVIAVPDCQTTKQSVISYINEHDIGEVMLVARWNAYLRRDLDTADNWLVVDGATQEVTRDDSKRVFATNLRAMVTDFVNDDRRVTIFQQPPEHRDFDRRHAFYRAIRTKSSIPLTPLSFEEHRMFNEFTDTVFADVGGHPDVQILNPQELLCTEQNGCLYGYDDVILYNDTNHLNLDGVELMRPLIEQFVIQRSEV